MDLDELNNDNRHLALLSALANLINRGSAVCLELKEALLEVSRHHGGVVGVSGRQFIRRYLFWLLDHYPKNFL